MSNSFPLVSANDLCLIKFSNNQTTLTPTADLVNTSLRFNVLVPIPNAINSSLLCPPKNGVDLID